MMTHYILVILGAAFFSTGMALLLAPMGKEPRPQQSWVGLAMFGLGATLLNIS